DFGQYAQGNRPSGLTPCLGLPICDPRQGKPVGLSRFFKRLLFPAAGIACLLLLAVAPATAQTLEMVRERGFLICGASSPLAGFSQQEIDGRWSGFDVDLCRALAAAIFGNPDLIEFRSYRGEARFAPLQTGAVDVLMRNGAWTIGRDTRYGARYVAPSFFDGQAFLVPQSLGVVSAYELDNISICVADRSGELQALDEFFFSNQTRFTEVVYEEEADLAVAYRAGL